MKTSFSRKLVKNRRSLKEVEVEEVRVTRCGNSAQKVIAVREREKCLSMSICASRRTRTGINGHSGLGYMRNND